MMSHPYDDTVSLETLENENLLSNRKDPGAKDEDCTGTVEVSKNNGSNGKLDDGTYKVNLCCVSIQKTYTYPGGTETNLTDRSKCDYVPEDIPTPPVPTTITCSAGKYLPKNSATCANCKSGNYCKGGTWNTSTTSDQGLTPCPAGYKNSAAGSSKIEQCYMNVVAGKYVKNKKDITQTACGKGTYKEEHNVYYNGTSKCTNCPAGYRDGAGATKSANCIMNVPKNNYVKKAKDSKPTACPSGQLKDQHNVYYGKISSCSSKTITVTFDCNGGTRSGPASVKYKSDVTGQKFTTTCTKKGYNQDGWKRDKNGTASNYTTYSGVSERFVLTYTPKITVYAHWKINSYKCSAGNYLKKSATNCTKCPANYYCPGGTFNYNTSSNQGINKCSEKALGYAYSSAGSDAANDCYMNVAKNRYVKKAKDSASTACAAGYYRVAHTVKYGSTSSCNPITVTINNPNNNRWVSKDYTLTLSTNISADSVKGWYYSYSNLDAITSKIGTNSSNSWVNYSSSAGKKSFVTPKLSSEMNRYLYVMVCNKDGVCKKSSTNIKIDKKAPICKIVDSVSSGSYNLNNYSWYDCSVNGLCPPRTNSVVNITVTCQETGTYKSGINTYYKGTKDDKQYLRWDYAIEGKSTGSYTRYKFAEKPSGDSQKLILKLKVGNYSSGVENRCESNKFIAVGFIICDNAGNCTWPWTSMIFQ